MTESTAAEEIPVQTEPVEQTPKRPRKQHEGHEHPAPTVARTVHFQLHGQEAPLAAIITSVPKEGEKTVGLVIFREHVTMFRDAVKFAETPTDGHWNWPPRAGA